MSRLFPRHVGYKPPTESAPAQMTPEEAKQAARAMFDSFGSGNLIDG
jgi:hypothetical protein